MSTSAFLEKKKGVLEQRIANKVEEYIALNTQYDQESNAATKAKLQRQFEDLGEEIDELEKALKKMDKPPISDAFGRMHELDFKEVHTTFQRTIGQIGGQKKGALFLMQRSLVMGGEWCIDKLEDLLRKQTKDFKPPYEVEFTPDLSKTEDGLLRRLGEYVLKEHILNDLLEAGKVQKCAELIIRNITGSVIGDCVIFIPLTRFDQQLLPWFVKDFWHPLMRRAVVDLEEYPETRFVCFIAVDEEIESEAFIGELFETEDSICEMLPREIKWKEEDICEWLTDVCGWDLAKSEEEARRIYSASDRGKPRLAYLALNQILENA